MQIFLQGSRWKGRHKKTTKNEANYHHSKNLEKESIAQKPWHKDPIISFPSIHPSIRPHHWNIWYIYIWPSPATRYFYILTFLWENQRRSEKKKLKKSHQQQQRRRRPIPFDFRLRTSCIENANLAAWGSMNHFLFHQKTIKSFLSSTTFAILGALCLNAPRATATLTHSVKQKTLKECICICVERFLFIELLLCRSRCRSLGSSQDALSFVQGTISSSCKDGERKTYIYDVKEQQR